MVQSVVTQEFGADQDVCGKRHSALFLTIQKYCEEDPQTAGLTLLIVPR